MFNMEFLFVYGTLLKDIENSMSIYLSRHADFYCKGYFYGRLYNLGEYPGAITGTNPNERVYGNIFKLKNPGKIFSVLDEYEEVGEKFPSPNEYRREKIKVYCYNNEIEAWIYLYNHSVLNLSLIPSGDYLDLLI